MEAHEAADMILQVSQLLPYVWHLLFYGDGWSLCRDLFLKTNEWGENFIRWRSQSQMCATRDGQDISLLLHLGRRFCFKSASGSTLQTWSEDIDTLGFLDLQCLDFFVPDTGLSLCDILTLSIDLNGSIWPWTQRPSCFPQHLSLINHRIIYWMVIALAQNLHMYQAWQKRIKEISWCSSITEPQKLHKSLWKLELTDMQSCATDNGRVVQTTLRVSISCFDLTNGHEGNCLNITFRCNT